jgi:hypothetical protein
MNRTTSAPSTADKTCALVGRYHLALWPIHVARNAPAIRSTALVSLPGKKQRAEKSGEAAIELEVVPLHSKSVLPPLSIKHERNRNIVRALLCRSRRGSNWRNPYASQTHHGRSRKCSNHCRRRAKPVSMDVLVTTMVAQLRPAPISY